MNKMSNWNGFEALSVKRSSCSLKSSNSHCFRLSEPLSYWSPKLFAIKLFYARWELHGYKHSFKSSFLFLRTVVLDPELAALVQTRDIREWDKKRSTLLTEKKPGARRNGASRGLWRRGLWQIHPTVPQKRWRVTNRGIFCWLSPKQHQSSRCEWPTGLLAFLLICLPQLKTLYISIPQAQDGIAFTLADLSSAGRLENLHTIYMCSVPQIGVSNSTSTCIIITL